MYLTSIAGIGMLLMVMVAFLVGRLLTLVQSEAPQMQVIFCRVELSLICVLLNITVILNAKDATVICLVMLLIIVQALLLALDFTLLKHWKQTTHQDTTP